MDYFWQLLASLAFGFGGAVVPIANPEAFILAVQATQLADPVPVAICLAIGQGAGKLLLFQAVRQGKKLPWPVKRKAPDSDAAPNKFAAFWRKLVAGGVYLVESPRWGALGAFLAGAVSIPPNYPTTILAGATKVSCWRYISFLTLGFTCRYLAAGLALSGIFSALFN